MPIIRPLRGILYDPSVAGPIERLVAPPYDVIGAEEQARLYGESAHNVIRLDLSRDADRYGAAARAWREWRGQGVLRRDAEPAFYAYAQRYELRPGDVRERYGFFGRLRIEEFSAGKILPHEKTLASAKQDRLELARACRANLSSIFAVYSSPGWELEKEMAGRSGAPVFEFTDRSGVGHRLWKLVDPALVAALEARLESRTVYIADGHHRYETALRYRDEMREATGRRSGEEPFDFVLAFVANVDEPGLTVLPTHRMLRRMPLGPEALLERLGALFRVEAAAPDALVARMAPGRGERRIGLVLADGGRGFVLSTTDGTHDARLSGSTALRRLDVTLLHRLILEGPGSVLGLDAHHEAEAGRLVYTKDAEEAVARTLAGEFAASFLLNATRVEEVRAVSEAHETMPEKSTYFFPKLLSGLVFNSLED